jgi:hypothetical protein
MKLSISLSERVGDSLGGLVRAHNSNPSAVVESALKCFLELPERNRERSVRETHASKKALSSSGWRSTFWTILAEEFDTVDFDQSHLHQSVMAPRSYDGFQINFLLSDVRNSNPDALIVHVMETPPYTEKTRYIGETKEYKLEDSVYQAARDVASWIREHRHLIYDSAHTMTESIGAVTHINHVQ